MALALASLGDIDIWAEFRWTSVSDLQLAALCSIPLQLLNAGLLLPSFSSDKLPSFIKPQAPKAGPRPEQAPGAAPAAPSEAAGDTMDTLDNASAVAGPSRAPASAAAAAAVGHSGDAGSQPPAPAQPADPGPEAGAASPSRPEAESGTSAQPPAGALPAAAWGSGGAGAGSGEWRTPWGAELTTLQGALHMAQGYYVSNNPTARLSPAVEAAVAFVDTAAGEMLYRGVALTWLARWLEDRVYEAGLEEVVTDQLPAAAARLGGAGAADAVSRLGAYGACECAVAAAVVSFVVWSVLWRSERAARKLELVVGAITSAARKAGRGAAPKGAVGSRGDGDDDASKAAASGGTKDGRGMVQMAFGPDGPPVDVARAGKVMRGSAAVQATRDGFQVLLLNGIFIATGGNLAASFAASLANQLIFSALQRRAMQRMRKRSEELARELLALNIGAKQRNAAAQKPEQPSAAPTRVGAIAEPSAGEAARAASTSDPGAAAPGGQPSRLDAAAGAEAASASGSVSDSLPATVVASELRTDDGATHSCAGSAGPSSAAPAEGSPGDGDGRSSGRSLNRALAMLDQLVPEPPRAAAASAKRPGQK